MIEEKERLRMIGEVLSYDDTRDAWNIKVFKEDVPFHQGILSLSTETLEGMADICLGDDMNFIFQEVEVTVCSECGRDEPFYNQKTEEYYCPACEG
jgi:Zn finger protein HypA/HybF involved in hydrogenase expression